MNDREKIKILLKFFECDILEGKMSIKVLGKKSLPVLIYKFNDLGEIKELYRDGKWFGQKGEIKTNGRDDIRGGDKSER